MYISIYMYVFIFTSKYMYMYISIYISIHILQRWATMSSSRFLGAPSYALPRYVLPCYVSPCYVSPSSVSPIYPATYHPTTQLRITQLPSITQQPSCVSITQVHVDQQPLQNTKEASMASSGFIWRTPWLPLKPRCILPRKWRRDLIRTSVYGKHVGSMKITRHLDRMSHFKKTSYTNQSNDGPEYLSEMLAAIRSRLFG